MFGLKVTIPLEEKGVKYEYKEEDLFNKSPLLLQMNLIHKKVSVLIHNGKSVCESSIIVQYIDEVWKDKAPLLLPSDSYQRAEARFWADFIDKKLYEAGRRIWLSEQREEEDEAKKELIYILKNLERKLRDKPYFRCENFGYVDLYLMPYHSWFFSYETDKEPRISARVPRPNYKYEGYT